MPRSVATNRTPVTRSTVTTPRREVDNLVFNGDFEYAPAFTAATNTAARFIDGTASGSISNSIYGWSVSGSNGFAAQFDTTEYKTGTKSMKISTTNTGSYVELFVPTYQNDKATYFGKVIPIQPNTSYTYSFWMKTNLVSGTATNGAYMALLFSAANGGSNASCTPTINTTIVKTTQNWTQYSGTFTTTSVDAFVQINLRIYGHQGTATLIMDAWFDDIVLTKTTPDTRQSA
jgi:hypothetical protein